MKNERNNLSDRLLNFASEIIKLVVQLNKTAVGRHIGGQLTRSSTSAGANYEEACGAESRFIQEAKELTNIIAKSVVTAKKNK